MTRDDMLQQLERWRAAGWLHRLGLALARFVAETDTTAPPSLLLGAAWLAQLEGQGHGGLPVDEAQRDLMQWLGWPPDANDDLLAATAMWRTESGKASLAWQGCPSIEIEPTDVTGTSPLVLSGGLLYLRRYWRHETQLAAQVRARASTPPDDIDRQAARTWLDRLFPPDAAGAEPDWQKIACAVALRGRLTLVTGGPGTGKTYTAARLLVLLRALHAGPQPLRVALAAPTGKAAARLRQSINNALQRLNGSLEADAELAPAKTLHALLGAQPGTRRFRHDAAHPLDVDLLIVDEASMVHLEMMAQLLEALPVGARLVLLGDKDQLASVEAGAVMGDLCQGAGERGPSRGYTPDTVGWIADVAGVILPASLQGDGPPLQQQTVVLRRSHRFGGPIGQLALAMNQGDGRSATRLLTAGDGGPAAMLLAPDATAVVRLALQGRGEEAAGYRPYLEELARRPSRHDSVSHEAWARDVLRQFERFRVLCAVREGAWGVSGLNQSIERAMMDNGLLVRRGEWYEGRPVMVTRNDPALGVFNGDIGIVLGGPPDDRSLRCWFLDGDRLHSVAVSRLPDVETAFAMTVHKSQGSEYAHVALVLPDEDLPVLSRELLYTGITRASQALTVMARHPALLAAAAARQTRRVSGLRRRL